MKSITLSDLPCCGGVISSITGFLPALKSFQNVLSLIASERGNHIPFNFSRGFIMQRKCQKLFIAVMKSALPYSSFATVDVKSGRIVGIVRSIVLLIIALDHRHWQAETFEAFKMFLLGHIEEVISHRRWCAIFGVLIDIFASPFQLPFNCAHVTFEREIVHLALQPIERTLDRFHPQCSKRSVFRFP